MPDEYDQEMMDSMKEETPSPESETETESETCEVPMDSMAGCKKGDCYTVVSVDEEGGKVVLKKDRMEGKGSDKEWGSDMEGEIQA